MILALSLSTSGSETYTRMVHGASQVESTLLLLSGLAGQIGYVLAIATLSGSKSRDGVGVVLAGHGSATDGNHAVCFGGQQRIGGANGHDVGIVNLSQEESGCRGSYLLELSLLHLVKGLLPELPKFR